MYYSSVNPVIARPVLVAPVVGENLDCSLADNLVILSVTSGSPKIAASVNSSKVIASEPGCATSCISCNLGSSVCAAVNNSLACCCVIPAPLNLSATVVVILNPALAASPPIWAEVILPAIISYPTVGSNAPKKIASDVKSIP